MKFSWYESLAIILSVCLAWGNPWWWFLVFLMLVCSIEPDEWSGASSKQCEWYGVIDRWPVCNESFGKDPCSAIIKLRRYSFCPYCGRHIVIK